MKNFTTYLFVMFMVMFWVFRMVVAVCYNLGVEFITTPLDLNYEIVLLFLTFLSIILVVKRSILGGIIYFIGNGLYFGMTIYEGIIRTGENYIDVLFAFMGIVLPFLVLLDLILDKNRKAHPVDKKTDWFYKNEAYDRELDERADKNHYKF